jgi:ubiquinol-cytochrome c reductase cytochrome b subunit
LIPFIDRYKKFSWKDRPLITAIGITGIAQIMVTTYWGFYIPSDTTIPLVERLVIDPINLYTVMILLVPISFGFTYMMIHLARDAERKAKMAKEQGPKKVSQINLSEKWINWVLVALIGFQVFLNIAAYNASITGLNNLSLFFVGLILIVFAGLFHIYRYGLSEASKIPPPPLAAIPEEKPKALAEQPKSVSEAKQLSGPGSGSDDKKETPKEAPQEVPPKIQADSKVPKKNMDPNLGTSDPKKL